LIPQPQPSKKSGVVEKGDKKKTKESHLQFNVIQLCSVDVEAYIKWYKQVRQVWNQNLYDTPKSKVEISSHILHGEIKDKWDM